MNIAPVENIQKSYTQRHKVMVTSSEHNHVGAEFIRRLRDGVFSLFRNVVHYDMNDSHESLCALIQSDLWRCCLMGESSTLRRFSYPHGHRFLCVNVSSLNRSWRHWQTHLRSAGSGSDRLHKRPVATATAIAPMRRRILHRTDGVWRI